MNACRAFGLIAVAMFVCSCGGGTSPPTTPGPSPVPPAPPPPSSGLTGVLVHALTDAPIPGVLVRIAGLPDVTSGVDGRFSIASADAEQLRRVTLTSSGTVERVTHVRVPGPEARLTLMPSTLDLAAFNQMFRSSGGLQRWTSSPRVVVQSRVLQFTNVTDTEYVAIGETMTDAEVSGLLADLTYGLPQMTGSAFSSFASESREQAAQDERVGVSRAGIIVVARYEGLSAATGYWGYARWGTSAGEVVRGIVMIDRGFDTSGSVFRRSLRIHELGHALGYNHVTVRDSVMNSHARFEPNAFDRDAARFAFFRPPLNRAPDTDPDPFSVNRTTLTWHGDR
jgi:hypothetical protein